MKEIVINVDVNENKTVMLVENGHLLEQYEENTNIKRLEGNIYIGKIQNVLQGMQAAFVDIGEKKNTRPRRRSQKEQYKRYCKARNANFSASKKG